MIHQIKDLNNNCVYILAEKSMKTTRVSVTSNRPLLLKKKTTTLKHRRLQNWFKSKLLKVTISYLFWIYFFVLSTDGHLPKTILLEFRSQWGINLFHEYGIHEYVRCVNEEIFKLSIIHEIDNRQTNVSSKAGTKIAFP